MIKTAIAMTAALAVSLLTACATNQSATLSAEDIACPASSAASEKALSPMPGSASLAHGIVLFDQGRYASAYAAFQNAIDQGLPDAIERAQAYRNIGLLMCRLDSAEACQRNFEIAFLTGGVFGISGRDLQLPHAQTAYDIAKQKFLNRCGNVAMPLQKEQLRINLVLVQSPRKNKKQTAHDAKLLLRVKPWASVSIDDDSEIITPPVKIIRLKPGERSISISHPNFEPVIIERDFKTGQTWLLEQTY
jgi:tetratricopeptide (TPR) repeat protein